MGQLMKFYAGDARAIGAAFAEQRFSALHDPAIVLGEADFSLHLSPIDLDLFSEAACSTLGLPPATLTDSLIQAVGGDGQHCSAEVVSDAWVAMIATLSVDQIPGLALLWLENVAQEHSEPVGEPTSDLIQSITDLIGVCRTAIDHNVPVVHTWSL